MSDINPNDIYRRYEYKELDKGTALGYLKAIIEGSSNEEQRVLSVELIGKIDLRSDEVFEFLEHLLTSDKNEEIRIASVRVFISNCLEECAYLLKWVFQHEHSIRCLVEILRSLQSCTSTIAKKLICIFEKRIESRFAQIDYYEREEMGLGQIDRLLGKIQPYLTDTIFFDEVDILVLDKLYDEILELVEIELIPKNIISEIMLLFSERYLAEAAMENDWHEHWLLYQKAMLSSEFGLLFNPNDEKLLFNFGVTCKYLDLYYPAINAFLCLYKIEKKLDKRNYKRLKRIKEEGGIIVEYVRFGPLDYLAQLYKEVGLKKKQKWAIEQNLKRKSKFRKLKTNWK